MRVQEVGALPPEEVRRRWQRLGGEESRVAATPQAAVQLAMSLRAEPRQPVVVAGSLYLVGAVRGILRGEEE
jgi:folylpolyglutamate synthase/dihydropteroate synthase